MCIAIQAMARRYGSQKGQGRVSVDDEEGTQNACPWWLQLCMGSMGPSVVMLQLDMCPWCFDMIACFKWFLRTSVWGTGVCGPLEHAVLYSWASVIPEQHQHHFSCVCLHVEFFGFVWAGMALFSACPLHFMLEVVDPNFTSSHYALQEAVIFCFIL